MATTVVVLKDGTEVELKGDLTPEEARARIQKYRASGRLRLGEGASRPSLPEQILGAAKIGAKRAMEIPAGIGSGVFSTGLGVAKLLGTVPPQTTLEDIGMQPRTPIEKAAMTGEQIGEFFLPAGTISRGQKAIAAAKSLPSWLPWAAKAAMEAGSAAGITGAQGGSRGEVITNAALGGGLGMAARLFRAGAGQAAKRLYQSALKPSTVLPQEARQRLLGTGLKEAIPVTEEGAQKLWNLVEDLNSKVSAEIAARPATINKFAVTSRLGETAAKFSSQVNPEADLRAISETGEEFLRTNPSLIPATEAQAMKQGTYRILGDKSYGELKAATVEAQKTLARGIKEELVKQFPEISQLNAREGALLGLSTALEKAVGRIGNRQIFGIGTPIAATAGAAVSEASVGLIAGLVKAVIDNPSVKSHLAIALYRGATKTPFLPLAITGPAIASRIEDYSNRLDQTQARGEK